jgi:hypothetical protein
MKRKLTIEALLRRVAKCTQLGATVSSGYPERDNGYRHAMMYCASECYNFRAELRAERKAVRSVRACAKHKQSENRRRR